MGWNCPACGTLMTPVDYKENRPQYIEHLCQKCLNVFYIKPGSRLYGDCVIVGADGNR